MIIEKGKIEFALKTQNPFVATMHHVDHYPLGDGQLRPSIKKQPNRNGDFDPMANWRMYYGKDVPGFPAHPHRGFETVTVVLEGTVDHADGLGSKGRYSDGDVQWMTAGKGLQHSEMFPLLSTDHENRLELFQIWLSLDNEHRMVEPNYKMLWREEIPVTTVTDNAGLKVKITLYAGELNGKVAPTPPKNSWASDPKNHLSIQIIELAPRATYILPEACATMNRSLYFYEGEALSIDAQLFTDKSYAFVTTEMKSVIRNEGSTLAKVLLLEAEPILEPIMSHGPFVMTTNAEIEQAFKDYRETQFGGWPFSSSEIYHDVNQVRFAEYVDGSVEYPTKENKK